MNIKILACTALLFLAACPAEPGAKPGADAGNSVVMPEARIEMKAPHVDASTPDVIVPLAP